jgi:hypothetical protein
MRPRIVWGILGTLLKIQGAFMPVHDIVLTNYGEPSGADAFALISQPVFLQSIPKLWRK